MNRIIIFLGLSLLLSCAIESVPTGGDKDITPPEITVAEPENFQTNFKSREISITFDEYVELKSFSQQFSVSPPISEKIDQNLKGKTLTLELPDSLQENTTYTLNFGNSIVDITEGNPQTSFKYVFSTGPILDSLKVQGLVHNALSGKPVAGALAMLFATDEDSIGYKSKPQYYAVTQEDGSFSIENVRDNRFQLLIVDDKDFNLLITTNREPRGFADGFIKPGNDTLYNIRTFTEPNALRLSQLKQTGFGLAKVYYSNHLPQDFRLTSANNAPFFIDFREGRDTLTLFYEKGTSDTSLFYAFYSDVIDTLFIRNADFDPVKPKLSAQKPTVTPSDTLVLTSNIPIASLDTSQVVFVKNKDTVATPTIVLDSNRFDVYFDEPITFGDQYAVHFYPGFIEPLLKGKLDTGSVTFSTKTEVDYAVYIISLLQPEGQQSIVQLQDEKGNRVFQTIVIGKSTIQVPFLTPDTYTLRVILDDNKNGKWDTGNYLEGQQPERVLYYSEAIELRANWEIETIWDIK